MKTIGLIGGMSWESSLEYYRLINEGVNKRLGGLHSAKCILYSVEFHEIEDHQKKGRWDMAAGMLNEAAKSLEASGSDFIVLCTNTMHKVAHEMMEGVHIPLLHIADATAEQILSHGINTVGLLGTRYTMEQEFYRARLESQGIEVLVPKEADRPTVNSIIFDELCLGVIKEESRAVYERVIDDLVKYGAAQGVVLGCTEIGMLVKPRDFSVPIFDTTYIHAMSAVNFALID